MGRALRREGERCRKRQRNRKVKQGTDCQNRFFYLDIVINMQILLLVFT